MFVLGTRLAVPAWFEIPNRFKMDAAAAKHAKVSAQPAASEGQNPSPFGSGQHLHDNIRLLERALFVGEHGAPGLRQRDHHGETRLVRDSHRGSGTA